MRLYPVRSNSQYPLQNFEVLTPNSSNTVVKPLILRKQLAVLGPAFSRLVCESHGVSEADVPEDVVRVLQVKNQTRSTASTSRFDVVTQ